MRSKDGFTLIELMIVVVIIGILAALAIPKFSGVAKQGKEAEARPILKQLYTLQMRYVEDQGSYATTIGQLEGGVMNFDGKYYDFSLGSADGSVYIACATPKDASLGLRGWRIIETGAISEGGC